MSNHREVLRYGEALHFLVLLFCTLFYFANCGPCSMSGEQNPVIHDEDECGSYRDNLNLGFQEGFVGDFSREIESWNSMPPKSLENVCTRSNLFCFPSTLPGFFSEAHDAESAILEFPGVQSDATLLAGSNQATDNLSWSSNCGSFKLLSGRVVSCSLKFQEGLRDMSYCQIGGSDNDFSSCRGHLLDWRTLRINPNEESVKMKSDLLDGSSSFQVDINPPLLDWGEKYLYFPSVAFLTVRNTHRDNVLNVYEPFSTSNQFYPCNFSEVMLGPGEAVSICFVFLPTWLGSSSAQLILQTSLGGFLIQSRGFAKESPYGVQPLVGVDHSSSGGWNKNLSLYNPFDETLYVEEVTAWISFSSRNTSHSTKAICTVKNPEGSADHSKHSVKEWLDVKSGEVGIPVMAITPHRKWEVGPNSSETIIELDFYHFQGKIVGSFCIQLLRPSQNVVDTVMVPLEAEVGERSMYEDVKSPLSVSLKVLVPCDDNGIVVVAVLLENAAHYILTVVKISGTGESTKSFQIKYVEGLILFPGSITQAAIVTYIPLTFQSHDPPSQRLDTNMNCKFFIVANESSTHQIEIPCDDIVSISSRRQSASPVGYGHHVKEVDSGNAETRYLDRSAQSPLKFKAMEMAEADELVLENWRSQGTASGMSVLDDHEVLFPLVHVGTHQSKWITVKNPSRQPVVMQLILNSGEIIDECRESDAALQSPSSSSLVHREYTSPKRYGFSIAESALTEVYVHPHGSASLGPILFHPSSRCTWKSSALVRNNISGVEWVSLRGIGGSLSLLLYEGPESVQTIEFEYKLPSFLNFSPHDMLSNVEGITHACVQPFLKELYAKNSGDLPLEVGKIEVSGTECGLDGFKIHPCKGFALEPGESMKLMVSYRTDFSAPVVQRDLELSLATGILVIPMKASLPISMLNMCKRSFLWIRLKKSAFPILLAGFMMFLVFSCILPQITSLGSQDYSFKGGKFSIGTVLCPENSSRVLRNEKHCGKFAMSTDISGFFRSIGEGKTSKLESVGRCPDGSSVALGQPKTAQHSNGTVVHRVQTNCLPDTKKEVARPSSLSKSTEVESSVAQEMPPPGNLTVKIEKEKGRRRRKKKSVGTGLAGQFEVSSSHSGNSTPSSPLSPISSLTPKRSQAVSPDVGQCVEVRNPFTHVPDGVCQKSSVTIPVSGVSILQPKVSLKYGGNSLPFPTQEKPSSPRKSVCKPVLLPCATFPSTGKPASSLMCPSPVLASTSTVAPHARAPGSKLYSQKAIKTEEERHGDEFKYDIWGDHLFGYCLTGKSNDVPVMSPLAKESNSSFFARGPQSLVSGSEAKFVSSNQEG